MEEKRRTRSGGPAQYSEGLTSLRRKSKSPAKRQKTSEKATPKGEKKAKGKNEPKPMETTAETNVESKDDSAIADAAAAEGKDNMGSGAPDLTPITIAKWLESNANSFLPPVCNKMMHGDGQLKIMYIGGPNQRRDFHIEPGEEFFHMVKGDMCLKILEKGQPKDVHIKEGEVFVLPGRIPHSPQRDANTIGLVIERERSEKEIDGLRFYCDDGVTILYEEWFHCTDLGTQIAPVIKRFEESEQCKTGKPAENGKQTEPLPLIQDMETEVDAPFSLKEWLENNKDDLNKTGSKELFGKAEFKITVTSAETNEYPANAGETFLWQLKGESSISCGTAKPTILTAGQVLLLAESTSLDKYTVVGKDDSQLVVFRNSATAAATKEG